MYIDYRLDLDCLNLQEVIHLHFMKFGSKIIKYFMPSGLPIDNFEFKNFISFFFKQNYLNFPNRKIILLSDVRKHSLKKSKLSLNETYKKSQLKCLYNYFV